MALCARSKNGLRYLLRKLWGSNRTECRTIDAIEMALNRRRERVLKLVTDEGAKQIRIIGRLLQKPIGTGSGTGQKLSPSLGGVLVQRRHWLGCEQLRGTCDGVGKPDLSPNCGGIQVAGS